MFIGIEDILTMQQLRCETVAQVMRLPYTQRMDMLEFIGGSEVSDAEVQRIVVEMGRTLITNHKATNVRTRTS